MQGGRPSGMQGGRHSGMQGGPPSGMQGGRPSGMQGGPPRMRSQSNRDDQRKDGVGNAENDRRDGELRDRDDVDRRGGGAGEDMLPIQRILSKDEVIKRYDTNGDGALDFREKMTFLRSLNEVQKAAYRKEFAQVGPAKSAQPESAEKR